MANGKVPPQLVAHQFKPGKKKAAAGGATATKKTGTKKTGK